MWRTWLPVRIQPRLREAHLGTDIDAILSWSPKEAKVRKYVPDPWHSQKEIKLLTQDILDSVSIGIPSTPFERTELEC